MDRFKREVARCIAKGRLTENPLTVYLPDLPSNHEITRVIMNALLQNSNTPSRAQKAARLWLRNSAAVEKALSSTGELIPVVEETTNA
jgi:hypothetical protein